jgi:WS/DGAT/MGAT family acyltransferase
MSGGTGGRLNEADANFVMMGLASGKPYVPVAISIYDKPFDEAATEHLMAVMARLLPSMFQRIRRDPFSTALPRWEDVPGFDPNELWVQLPPPGDGTLRAVIDWAQDWGRLDLPLDLPPWRSVYFEGVTVDGVPDRMVAVSQFHHALMDGQGGMALAEQFYQWAPDGELPALPPLPARDERTAAEHWREGWADELGKVGTALRAIGTRVGWAAAHPSDGARRVREYVAAGKRLAGQMDRTPHSPLLVRRTDRYRFDFSKVDLDALRAGARSAGGSANDGLMAAVSLGLARYHLDHGLRVPQLRMAMPISTRTEDDAAGGNQLTGGVLQLPLLEDAAIAVKESRAVSRALRDDRDALVLMDRFRTIGNRLPKAAIRSLFVRSMGGIDLSLSNVKGMPLRNWIAGVEVLDTVPFIVGGPALCITLISGPALASLGVVTCPEAVPDPDLLMQRLEEGIAEVSSLAATPVPQVAAS